MTDSIPEAIVMEKSRFSMVWIIPLLALMLGGWLTFKYLNDNGTRIEITFDSANGLVAGKTKIKVKDVVVGVIDEINFTEDLSRVQVSATINKEMRSYLSSDTRFWVVRARLAAGEISGLNTLLSGAYIGMSPGTQGKLKKTFNSLDKAPSLLEDSDGSHYQLNAESLHSFDAGTPVYYRRLKVGEIVEYSLDKSGKRFEIDIFVGAPYNKLVHKNTLFWNASGVDINLNADGFQMRTESMVSLIQGGLAFDTLEAGAGEVAEPGTAFKLFESREIATNIDYKRSDQQYRLYFDGSARGLNAGAPVTLRGIKFGQVIDVSLQYDLRDNSFKIPVTIEFEPDRLNIVGRASPDEVLPTAADLVKLGLRAQLRSGNLLTGQMLIDFDLYPDAKPAVAREEEEYIVLPTIPTSIDSMMNSLTSIMEKISRMPLDEIGDNLNNTLLGTNTLVNSDAVKQILNNINESSLQAAQALEAVNALVRSEDIDTIMSNLGDSSVQLNEAIRSVNSMINSSDLQAIMSNINIASLQLSETLQQTQKVTAGLTPESIAYQEMVRTLRELSGASRALRQMAEYLERHPEALLKGKPR